MKRINTPSSTTPAFVHTTHAMRPCQCEIHNGVFPPRVGQSYVGWWCLCKGGDHSLCRCCFGCHDRATRINTVAYYALGSSNGWHDLVLWCSIKSWSVRCPSTRLSISVGKRIPLQLPLEGELFETCCKHKCCVFDVCLTSECLLPQVLQCTKVLPLV